MSLHESLAVVLAVAKDTAFAVADSSAVQEAAKAVSQGAAATVAEAVENSAFSAKVTLGQVVEFQLTGLLVVFTVLGGLTLMLYLMAWLLKTFAPDQYHCRKTAPAAPAAGCHSGRRRFRRHRAVGNRRQVSAHGQHGLDMVGTGPGRPSLFTQALSAVSESNHKGRLT